MGTDVGQVYEGHFRSVVWPRWAQVDGTRWSGLKSGDL